MKRSRRPFGVFARGRAAVITPKKQPPNPGGAAPDLTFRDGINLLGPAAPRFFCRILFENT